ncbi:keratin, type II cytoskeletal 1-like [Anopheles stephensi]|uniref:keratin, type II cytoskeletal 1-like n=1 Tax=Anopheles stephensi TaxID=30069 RepID=UPI001658992D|nr:keratin, type II cytoskeletal 1-like [Anopheles stephensi]
MKKVLLSFCAVWFLTNAAPTPEDPANTVQGIVPVQNSPVVILDSDTNLPEEVDLEGAEAAHFGYGGGGFGRGGGFGGGYGHGGGFGFRKFGGFGGGGFGGHHGFGGGFPGHGFGGFGGGGGGFVVGGGFIKGGGFYGKK